MVMRHLLAILALPVVAALAIPAWLTSWWTRADPGWPQSPRVAVVMGVVGFVLLLAGLALFAWCVSLFARVGEGTLAPWDPTPRLVSAGPYRFVRNPMITGVATILMGQSLLIGSRSIAEWTVAFVLINHAYFVLFEEPGLERRFGAAYARYRAEVPRWIPRTSAWDGAAERTRTEEG